MEPHKENQIFIFEDDEQIVEAPAPQQKSEADRFENMLPIQLNDESQQSADLNDHLEQVASPNFHSLPPDLKGQRGSWGQANPQLEEQPQEPSLTFVEQNAYSFRKGEFEQKPKIKPKQIAHQLDIISDFNSEISKSDVLFQGHEEDTSGISRKNERSRRSKNRSKFQDINDASSVASSKLADKISHLNEPQKLVPNILEPQSEKREEEDYHKTEDHLRHDRNNHAEIIESMNAINRSRKHERALPPIGAHKGQIFINTSGILQNESSMVAIKPKEDFHKLSMTNMSSLTQMLHSNQNDKMKKVSDKVVPSGKTFKCEFRREKICCLSYWHPFFAFYYKDEKLVLNAQKQCGRLNSSYNISSEEKYFENNSEHFSGFLNGNFFGTIFNLYHRSDGVDEVVCTIAYETQFNCSSAFRKMEIYVKNEEFPTSSLYRGSNQKNFNLKQLYYLGQNAKQRKIFKLVNKKPEWNQDLGCFSMNFKGKCKMASVKNAVIVSEEEPNRYILLFCKTDHHIFHTQISYPLSPFIAMGIILSSFDFKLSCQ